MASPRLRASTATPAAGKSPRSRVLETSTPASCGSLSKEEAIWKRLKEAGFDEETVKRRDKAALVSYITKLETELYEYQYNMGILIVEKQEWASKYEQAKASADSAENVCKRDQAAQMSSLAEAKKQQESLKRALAIEKECVMNIEKALHDMRAEAAETKLAYESKLAEAREMMDTAQKKFEEAVTKLHSAESLHAEASRFHNSALRNSQEIEAREDELRRRSKSFQSECDVKEKQLSLQRQSLCESQRMLHQEQEKLLEGQTLLNMREDYILTRTKELSRLEKELEEAKAKFEEECRAFKEKKSNLDLDFVALATREEALIERESQLGRREQELLILQEKVTSKEYDEIQKLAAEHESVMEIKRCEFEAEIEEKRRVFEDQIEAKKAACEEKEAELIQRENLIKEKEKSIESQLEALCDSQEHVAKNLKLLEEKEQNIQLREKAVEMEMLNVQKEREEMKKMGAELEKIKFYLDEQKKEILLQQEKLELTINERSELLVLETKLKEEIDTLRAQKMELDTEADKLRTEKEKFEAEWELIDEKKEQLRKEAEHVAEERKAICQYLKTEYDSIKLEKDNLRNQFKLEAESLSREREEFMTRMEREHSDWIVKIQRERDDFVRDISIQRKELENCIEKRREEVETYLREKEDAIEREKVKELQYINSQKEMIAKQLEHVASELKRLDNERAEISLDREQREREWSEIKSSIEVLNIQREKLQKQRELLHVDREEIFQKIQHLNKLELLDIELENKALTEIHSQHLQVSKRKFPIRKCTNGNITGKSIGDELECKLTADGRSELKLLSLEPSLNASPTLSAPVSWVKKCASAIFKRSPEKAVGSKLGSHLEGKVSPNVGRISAEKDYKSLKSNLFERTDVNGKNASLSSLDNFQDPSVSSREGIINSQEDAAVNATLSAISEDANMGFNTSSLSRSAKSLPEAEHKNSRERFICQSKDVTKDTIRENTSFENGATTLMNGRKRLNDSSSSDHVELELTQKHQKKARQNNGGAMDGTSPICSSKTGRLGDAENQSSCDGVNKALEEVTGNTLLKAGELAKSIFASGAAPVDDSDKHEEEQDEDDEVDEEEDNGDEAEENRVSRLGKIWVFLTT